MNKKIENEYQNITVYLFIYLQNMLLQHYFFNILYTKKIKGINKPRSD